MKNPFKKKKKKKGKQQITLNIVKALQFTSAKVLTSQSRSKVISNIVMPHIFLKLTLFGETHC